MKRAAKKFLKRAMKRPDIIQRALANGTPPQDRNDCVGKSVQFIMMSTNPDMRVVAVGYKLSTGTDVVVNCTHALVMMDRELFGNPLRFGEEIELGEDRDARKHDDRVIYDPNYFLKEPQLLSDGVSYVIEGIYKREDIVVIR